jgi:hypothetical protein
VYNRIRSDNVTTKVESLFPEPEKPVLPQILAIEQNAPEAGFVAMEDVKPVDPLQQPVEKIEPVVVQKEAQPSEKPKPAPVVVAAPAVVEVSVPQPKKEVIELAPMGTPLVNKEKKSKTKELWRVQLFASNSKPAVEKAWKRIQVKHAKLLSNMSYLIKKVEIPRKGDFFRLQVGQFPSREMAEGLCTKLRVQKQDCLPVK